MSTISRLNLSAIEARVREAMESVNSSLAPFSPMSGWTKVGCDVEIRDNSEEQHGYETWSNIASSNTPEVAKLIAMAPYDITALLLEVKKLREYDDVIGPMLKDGETPSDMIDRLMRMLYQYRNDYRNCVKLLESMEDEIKALNLELENK